MTKEHFKALFESALEIAAENAEMKLGHSVPRNFEIQLHGLAPQQRLLTKEGAFEAIYLGPDRFYRVIDLAVVSVSNKISTVFMRLSGHQPGTLEQTWDQPPGSGPFKQLLADEVKLT